MVVTLTLTVYYLTNEEYIREGELRAAWLQRRRRRVSVARPRDIACLYKINIMKGEATSRREEDRVRCPRREAKGKGEGNGPMGEATPQGEDDRGETPPRRGHTPRGR